MTIREIERIVETLSQRHQNLDEVLLVNLLRAGGWEDSFIKDATLVFKTRKGSSFERKAHVLHLDRAENPHTKNSSSENNLLVTTVISPMPTEPVKETKEMEQPPLEVVPAIQVEPIMQAHQETSNSSHAVSVQLVESKEQIAVISPLASSLDEPLQQPQIPKIETTYPLSVFTPTQISETLAQAAENREDQMNRLIELEKIKAQEEKDKILNLDITPHAEPQSLISEVQTLPRVASGDVPDNLPVKPFENTPHVWSFAKYKDVFYGEVLPPQTEEEKQLPKLKPQEIVTIEPVPLGKKDESLVFLAAVMLVAIMLLLGYMYSNGRL